LRRLAALLLFAAAPAGADEAFHARVGRAIDRGVAWLKAKQDAGGSWGLIGGKEYESGGADFYRYPAGPTALALLTLLKCGVPPEDPAVRKGFALLRERHATPGSVYEVSALMLALEAKANPFKRDRAREAALRRSGGPKTVKLAPADRQWMTGLKNTLVKWWKFGGWRYGGEIAAPFGVERDMSNTQLAVMALYVAHRAGIEVPPRLVRETVLFTLMAQEPSGPKHERYTGERGRTYAPVHDRARGWAYARGTRNPVEGMATGTMTTGGIVVLLLGRAMLEDLDPKALKADGKVIDQAIHDGLAWLDLHWTVEKNPPADQATQYHLMYLYGLERVGDLRRASLIGEHDWYNEGARWLVDHQKPDGRWEVADTHPPFDVLNTCFALLFLDRASLSVVTEKR